MGELALLIDTQRELREKLKELEKRDAAEEQILEDFLRRVTTGICTAESPNPTTNSGSGKDELSSASYPVSILSNDDLLRTLHALDEAGSPRERAAIIGTLAETNTLMTCSQVGRIMSTLPFPSERLSIAKLLSGQIVDKFHGKFDLVRLLDWETPSGKEEILRSAGIDHSGTFFF